MDCSYIAFCSARALKERYTTGLIQTSVGAFCHTHSHSSEHIRSNLRFSVLHKDTVACKQEHPGIKPPTIRLLDDLLYLLSHTHLLYHCRETHLIKGLCIAPQYKIDWNKSFYFKMK